MPWNSKSSVKYNKRGRLCVAPFFLSLQFFEFGILKYFISCAKIMIIYFMRRKNMEIEHIILIVLGVLALVWAFLGLCVLIAYICFHQTFYSPKSREIKENPIVRDAGEIFRKHMDTLVGWRMTASEIAYEDVYITSYDGLKLHGKLYLPHENAPVEIFFHGYRGSANRDMNGPILRAMRNGRNVLAIDQRASGFSEGNAVTFGAKESKDCLSWIEFLISLNKDVKIILFGVSMGAATVLIASGNGFPSNVIAVIADCGYTHAKEMINDTIDKMKLPSCLLYPFVKLGAEMFGRFKLDDACPLEAVKNSKTPTLFIHGDDDPFVPFFMGQKNYEACGAEIKKFVAIPGGGHGASYVVQAEEYEKTINDFLEALVK